MRLRLSASLVLLGLSALIVAGLTAAPAQAAIDCTLVAPPRVVIDAPEVHLVAEATGACTAPRFDATWVSERGGGYAHFYSSRPPADVVFDDRSVSYGPTLWEGAGLCQFDEEHVDICWDTDFELSTSGPSDVRAGTVAGITGSRSGSTVHLAASSFVYSTTAHRQVHRRAAGLWQVQERTGTTWRTVRSVTTPIAGITRITFSGQPVGRKYRFVLPATPTSWTGVSRTVAP